MSPAIELLCAFVLENSVEQPLTKRVALYRALASTVPGRCSRFKELTSIADELEQIEHRHRQLLIDLGDGQTGGRG